MTAPIVFICYSRRDTVWRDRIMGHLAVYERLGLLKVWVDRGMRAGVSWQDEVFQAIRDAGLVVLLISVDFLTSEFIAEQEIPRILKRHRRGDLKLVPVFVRDCPWKAVPWLAALQVRPASAIPLAELRAPQREAALAAIANEIAELLHEPYPEPVGRTREML